MGSCRGERHAERPPVQGLPVCPLAAADPLLRCRSRGKWARPCCWHVCSSAWPVHCTHMSLLLVGCAGLWGIGAEYAPNRETEASPCMTERWWLTELAPAPTAPACMLCSAGSPLCKPACLQVASDRRVLGSLEVLDSRPRTFHAGKVDRRLRCGRHPDGAPLHVAPASLAATSPGVVMLPSEPCRYTACLLALARLGLHRSGHPCWQP